MQGLRGEVRSSAVHPPACHACGQRHSANAYTGYFWLAVRSSSSFYPDGWNVLAITECGAMANTEAVASFVGKYHDAQRNAEECVGFHNTALAKRLGWATVPQSITDRPRLTASTRTSHPNPAAQPPFKPKGNS